MSFTIKCDKCGNEATLTQAHDNYTGYDFISTNNETLGKVDDQAQLIIKCEKCENEIIEDI